MPNTRDELKALQLDLEAKLTAVRTALGLLGEKPTTGATAGAMRANPRGLKAMRRPDALVAIAQRQGGRLHLPTAYATLRRVGAMRETRNWYNILHEALKGNFKGQGQGVYVLRAARPSGHTAPPGSSPSRGGRKPGKGKAVAPKDPSA